MRIISIRVEPVARILAIIYTLFGLSAFLLFRFTSSDYLTLPIGVVAPLIHLNVNLTLPRSDNFIANLILCVSAIVSYGVTGWLTGAAAAMCFNVVAKRMGGIDAKYVSTTAQSEASTLASEPSTEGELPFSR